jgi:predicted dinucleotide-binding enzyme
MKAGIIGAGAVGSACVTAFVTRGTSVPVQYILRLKSATVTTPTAEIGQTEGSAISP